MSFARSTTAEPYRFGHFTLDPAERRLYANGVPVPLGPTDLRVLLALVENAGAFVSKDDLLSLVGGHAPVGHNAVYVHISALRKALGNDTIASQQGRGYRLMAPVQGIESRAGNLPWRERNGTAGSPRLIGRSEPLRLLSNLLAECRLVTLTGPGGVGKTTLALQAAREASPRFRDGVWLVELAALNDAALVPSAIASALGVKVGANANPLETLPRHLARKSLLILFDNCEHVIAACSRVAGILLAAAPDVKLLATSREPLSCSGEQVIDIPPLAVPGEAIVSPDLMRGVAAVDLFIERAMEADANFRIDDAELPLVARICRRLDGLPLAIEMAAAWAGPLGLETLDARLDGSLKTWLRAARTAPPRHATLRATLEWSYGLLSAAEQAVLRRSAVFASSFTMPAAEAVASDDEIPKEQIIAHVAGLVRKSIIAVVPGSRPHHYRLLETTRVFLLEELARSGAIGAARQRHASYVLAGLETAMCEWETTSDSVWLERYSPMLDDVRAALDWAMGEDSDLAVALAGASWPLWRELPLGAEARQRLSAAAARLHPETPPALEARLRRGVGTMLLNAAASEAAKKELERSASLYRQLGDRAQLGSTLTALAYALFVLGRIEEASEAIKEGLGLLESSGWLRTLAVAYSIQMSIETSIGRLDAASIARERATRLCEIAGADRTALVLAANLVQLFLERGDLDSAIAAGGDVTARLRDSRHSDIRGFAFGFLAAAHTARGDLDEAVAAAREAAPLLRDEGTLFWLFDHLALRAAFAGRANDAALIAGYADAAHRKFGRMREPMGRRAVERLRALSREVLPHDEITRLGELGKGLSEDQALTIALGM